MKTKRLSLVLALIMMLSVFSGMFVVNAEETQNKWRIGETEYATWSDIPAEAFTAGTTIYMLADDTVSARTDIKLPDGGSITIEGVQSGAKNPTLTISGSAVWIRFNNKTVSEGILTVKNIDVSSSSSSGVLQASGGTMNLENMTIESGQVTYGVIITAGATTNITNSYISLTPSTEYTSAHKGGILFCSSSNGTFNVEGTTLVSEDATVKALTPGGTSTTYAGNSATLKDCTISTGIFLNKESSYFPCTLKGTNVINGNTVTAPDTGVVVDYKMLGNEVLYGAAVRVVAGADANDLSNSGLRFMSTVSADAIAAAGEGAAYGTVIFKYSDYTTWLVGNESKTMADFIAAANASDSDALKVVDIVANTGKVVDADGNMTIYAALVDINTTNYGTDFGAVSYIKTAENVVVYSAFYEDDHVRNITYVATAALADTSTTEGYEKDGYKYNYLVTEGVYSPYTDDQRALLNKYLAN